MPDCQNFGMGRGIIRANAVIVTAPDDLSVYQKQSSDRDFTLSLGFARLLQSFAHP
jgi:hypothetical protein